MRLGAAFWGGVSVDDPQDAVDRLDTIGVTGTVLVPGVDGYSDEEIDRVRTCFEAGGKFVAEVAAYRHGYFASGDEEQRRGGIAFLKKVLRDARKLNAWCVGISRPFGADGDWWSQATWRRLCASLEEAAETAAEVDVPIALHPTNGAPIDSPEQLRRLIDDVGSPHLKVMLDPVNMSTHRTCYNTTGFLNSMFDLLEADIIGAHAKDVGLDLSHWVLKLDEVPIGTGLLDYETYLRRLSEVPCPGLPFIIEHFRDVGVSGATISPNIVYYDTEVENTRARRCIVEIADRLGIAFD